MPFVIGIIRKTLYMKNLVFLLFGVTVFYLTGSSQQTKIPEIGIKLGGELVFHEETAPGGGIQLVYRIGKHHGFETGLFYQNRRAGSLITESTTNSEYFYYTKVFSQRLQLPVLYRFHSKPINFTIGPVIDISVGTSIKSNDPDPALKNFESRGTRLIGTAGLSRSFSLSSSLVLDPEIKFNYLGKSDYNNVDPERSGLAFNLCLRKKLR